MASAAHRGAAGRSVRAPSLRHERVLWRAGSQYVAGIDEVGMASLSGPVVAAAVVLRPRCRMIPGVRDSKLLSRAQREHLYPFILRQAQGVRLGAASVAEIDRLNILRASHLAMSRALRQLTKVDHTLVDGREVRDVDLGPHTALIDGDALSYAIASASIVAKVVRDRLMCVLATRYPGYGWERNAGYGTREHLLALRSIGLTPFHRRSYAPVQLALAGLEQAALWAAEPAVL